MQLVLSREKDDAINLQVFSLLPFTSTLLNEKIVDRTSKDDNKFNDYCGASNYNFSTLYLVYYVSSH